MVVLVVCNRRVGRRVVHLSDGQVVDSEWTASRLIPEEGELGGVQAGWKWRGDAG
jgi:hypothetical protein